MLILTRQALPTTDRTRYASAQGVQRGAYVLADTDDRKPQVLLLATGSEISLCLEAYEKLKAEGIKARVASMPSWQIFERYCLDHPEYREQVLPRSVTARVSGIEGIRVVREQCGNTGSRPHELLDVVRLHEVQGDLHHVVEADTEPFRDCPEVFRTPGELRIEIGDADNVVACVDRKAIIATGSNGVALPVRNRIIPSVMK